MPEWKFGDVVRGPWAGYDLLLMVVCPGHGQMTGEGTYAMKGDWVVLTLEARPVLGGAAPNEFYPVATTAQLGNDVLGDMTRVES